VKIKPEIFLNSKREITYNKVLVTGTDEALMSYVREFVISYFKKRCFFIDVSGNYNSGIVGELFSDKKTLFVLNDFSLESNSFDTKNSDDQFFLIISPNNKKTNVVKSVFAKTQDCLVVECYALNRSSKETTLKYFVENNSMALSKDVFWYIVDNLDNNYVIFKRQLEMLVLFNKKIDLISDIEKVTFVENKIEINKIFFKIYNNNKYLTNIFNTSINSISDFYFFLNSTKFYLEIINGSSNKKEALTKFPRYLFAEKDIFLKIYNKLNKDKLIRIYNVLSRAELLTRKHSDLYSVFGLRFFLNLKNIIIS